MIVKYVWCLDHHDWKVKSGARKIDPRGSAFRVMSIAGNSRQSSYEATHLQPAFSSLEYCKLPTSAALLQRRLARTRLLWNHRILQSGTEASSRNTPVQKCGD